MKMIGSPNIDENYRKKGTSKAVEPYNNDIIEQKYDEPPLETVDFVLSTSGLQYYALKRENVLRTKIYKEIEVLKCAMQHNCKQICQYIDDGRFEDHVFIVMTLLGKDLSKLRREQKSQNFSINTSLRVGLLTLSAIRELHHISVISRDIKPSNFALGLNEDHRNIYIFDFGLARFYRDQDGSILPIRHHLGFRGTTRYASLRAHERLELGIVENRILGRTDDLESWIYVMVELSSGTLLWKTSKIMKKKKKELKDQVYRAKLKIRSGPDRKQFFKNSLPILDYIFTMIDGLTFDADPPYQQIQYMFEKLMLEANVKWDDLYDWEEPAQFRQPLSADPITSTSIAVATYSRPLPLQNFILATPTASTESSSLPNTSKK
ncbi:unnamed protein product [Thelazia callipaeda]|uniref:Protein kinase domain-containing protein n=1 Tax=Thelazia callipaeda TaxID=103827 RepID=A0A0N5D6Y9_THECL|nr:unnamed protein product [Thelazia callipaeda]